MPSAAPWTSTDASIAPDEIIEAMFEPRTTIDAEQMKRIQHAVIAKALMDVNLPARWSEEDETRGARGARGGANTRGPTDAASGANGWLRNRARVCEGGRGLTVRASV